MFFFFSSRRRHTRSLRDWSSDVCSSDLEGNGPGNCRAVLVVDMRGNCLVHFLHALGRIQVGACDVAVGSRSQFRIELPELLLKRSEERRVGKECMLRRFVDDLTENMQLI